MDKFQEEDSPFRALLKDIKENPHEEEKITKSINRCVQEAPVQILNRTRRANAMRKKRHAMRRNASGNTAGYHKLMNALDRFGSSAEEPPEQVRNELSLKLAQYVMTEGNPANINYQKENCDMAARALKALLPKKDFDAFLTTANQNRAPGQKLRAEELEGPMPNAPEEKKPRKGRRSARQEEAEKAPEQQAGGEHNGEPYAEEYGEYDGQDDEQYEEEYDEEYSEQPNDEYAGSTEEKKRNNKHGS